MSSTAVANAAAGLPSEHAAWRHRGALAVMTASGFAGLGYQIVWTQQSAVWLGHESAAVLAVITAFFGGLALGSFAFGPRIERSTRPERWYAGCEVLIAVWGITLALVMPAFSEGLLKLTGAQPSPLWQWSVAFCGTFALLLPATAAMGATLPAMERVTSHLRGGGRSIADLYASNTFGAVLGVIATAFWLIPEVGLVRTGCVCVLLSLFCGVAGLGLRGPQSPGGLEREGLEREGLEREGLEREGSEWEVSEREVSEREVSEREVSEREGPEGEGSEGEGSVGLEGVGLFSSAGARAVLVRLAITGLLGIGYEVVVVRVLSQVSENTVYTFAMLLAVYLVGTAAGAAAYQRWVANRADVIKAQDLLLSALAIACLVSTACLWGAELLKSLALDLLGASMAAAIAGESVLAIVAFGPPTFVMGALFSHLSSRASASGVSFGRALAVNTLGATCAPLVFGVVVLPAFGAKAALLLIGAGYLMLISRREWRSPMAWGPAGAAIALALLTPRLIFIDVPDGGRVVSYREGVMGAVSVVEDAEGVLRLRIDNRQQEGSSATLRVDGRQGLLPVFLHPAPRHALFLGLGTGVTASTAAEVATLKVEAVELLPEVIAAAPLFTRAVIGDRPNPRLQPIPADARRYVRASEQRYDVIVSDNFHPARSGSGALYTVEHFAAVRDRLTLDGVFCQWLPLHQLDLQTFRSIVRSFLAIYPQGSAMLASNSLETPVIGLVGRADGGHFDIDALHARLASSELTELRVAIGIEDEYALMGSFIAGPRALARFAGNAPLNTDDRPVVAYSAPRITYAPDSSPRDRLFALLAESDVDPAELIGPAQESAPAARLAAYWQARDRFIQSGRNVQPSSDVRAMLAQVREPLLTSLRISPDFRPAYDPLLRMAIALSQSDPSAARELLGELIRIQPARREAQVELHRLDSPSMTHQRD